MGARVSRVLAVLGLLTVLQVPEGADAVPGRDDEDPTPREEREQVRERQGEVDIEIDVLEAELDEIADTLVILSDNVADHRDDLEEAERTLTDAEDDLDLVRSAVLDAEDEIDRLETANDDMMVAAYISPPVDNVRTTFSSGSMSDATLRQALIGLTSDTNADIGDQLDAAYEDLEVERDNLTGVAQDAEDARDEVALALVDLEVAVDQQNGFAVTAELALEEKLAEAATLADLDVELTATIEEEEWAELVRQLEAARGPAEEPSAPGDAVDEPAAEEPAPAEGPAEEPSAPEPSPTPAPTSPPAPSPPATSPPATSPPPLPAATVTPAPGGLATVTCPAGGTVTVAGSLAPNLRNLLNAAADSGLMLCGFGYRDPSRQIALRQQNCGTSSYATYQMPPSQCSPPTARPGTSMHEQGLAVDFQNCATRGTACYQWLASNASRFGLYNLPSEPWHWSTTGR